MEDFISVQEMSTMHVAPRKQWPKGKEEIEKRKKLAKLCRMTYILSTVIIQVTSWIT